jgi:hypothetical protein
MASEQLPSSRDQGLHNLPISSKRNSTKHHRNLNSSTDNPNRHNNISRRRRVTRHNSIINFSSTNNNLSRRRQPLSPQSTFSMTRSKLPCRHSLATRFPYRYHLFLQTLKKMRFSGP